MYLVLYPGTIPLRWYTRGFLGVPPLKSSSTLFDSREDAAEAIEKTILFAEPRVHGAREFGSPDEFEIMRLEEWVGVE